MKELIILLYCAFPLQIIAQSEGYHGNYQVRYEMNDGSQFEYNISLNADGTFLFHAYEYHTRALTPEKNRYGKGTWSNHKNLISLTTNVISDLDDKHTLDLTNTKARIDRKSSRNKSLDIVPDTMRIYHSDIYWVKGLKLTKVRP